MTDFKVGDRVRYIGEVELLFNREGVLNWIDRKNPLGFAVAFDGFEGHTCNGHTPDWNGFWCPEHSLELSLKQRAEEILKSRGVSFVDNEIYYIRPNLSVSIHNNHYTIEDPIEDIKFDINKEELNPLIMCLIHLQQTLEEKND